MPARNLPHVGRKFTRESAKLERQRKKEERRRRRRDERPKQPAHTEIETLIGTLKIRLAHYRNDGPNPWPSFTRPGGWPAKANANGSGDRQDE